MHSTGLLFFLPFHTVTTAIFLPDISEGQTLTDADCDRKIDDNCSARGTIGLTTSSKIWSLAHDAETYQSDTAITLLGRAMNYSKAVQVRCLSKGTSLQRTISSYIGKKKSLPLQDFWYTFSKLQWTTQRKKSNTWCEMKNQEKDVALTCIKFLLRMRACIYGLTILRMNSDCSCFCFFLNTEQGDVKTY